MPLSKCEIIALSLTAITYGSLVRLSGICFRIVAKVRSQVERAPRRLGGLLLASGLAAAVAGQAVGPVLSGSNSGSVNLTVGQAVRLTPFTFAYADSGNSDAVVQVNDEGTHFTAALEVFVGGQDN